MLSLFLGCSMLWEMLTGREHLQFYGRLKSLSGSALDRSCFVYTDGRVTGHGASAGVVAGADWEPLPKTSITLSIIWRNNFVNCGHFFMQQPSSSQFRQLSALGGSWCTYARWDRAKWSPAASRVTKIDSSKPDLKEFPWTIFRMCKEERRVWTHVRWRVPVCIQHEAMRDIFLVVLVDMYDTYDGHVNHTTFKHNEGGILSWTKDSRIYILW